MTTTLSDALHRDGERAESPSTPPSSEGEPEREGFEVHDVASLDWALRRIANAKSRMAEQSLTAEKLKDKLRKEMNDIDAWLEHVNKGDVATIQRMEGFCVSYLWKLHEADPSVKSVTAPHGEVKSRAAQPDYERDEATLKAWAVENGYVRPTEPAIDWAAIKAAATVKGERLVLPGGEVVPGCVVRERPRRYDVVTP